MSYIVRGLREGVRIFVRGRLITNGSIDSDADISALSEAGYTLDHHQHFEVLEQFANLEVQMAVQKERTSTERQIAKRWRELMKPLRKSTHDPSGRRYGRENVI